MLIGRDDGQPYLVWQQKDGTWGAVELILHFKHAPLSAVAPAVGTDGYLQVICVGRDDGQPYLIWQDAVNGTWNDYGVLANPEHLLFSSVVTGVGNQDMIQAILLTRDSGLPYHLWHNHQGKWSQAWALPDFHRTPFSALATGNAANTALQVICLGRDDGRPYFFSQDPTFASWPVSRKLNEPLQQQVAVPPVGGGQNKPDF